MNRTALAFALVAAATLVGGAQQPGVPDLAGGWVRVDTEGSGSFNFLTQKFTPAALTPAAAAEAKAAAQPQGPRFDFARDPSAGPKAVGEAYVVTEGRCGQATGAGVPLEPNSAAFSYEPRSPQPCDAFDEDRTAFLEKP